MPKSGKNKYIKKIWDRGEAIKLKSGLNNYSYTNHRNFICTDKGGF